MIQYLLAAGFGALLGTSNRSKKSYARGGRVPRIGDTVEFNKGISAYSPHAGRVIDVVQDILTVKDAIGQEHKVRSGDIFAIIEKVNDYDWEKPKMAQGGMTLTQAVRDVEKAKKKLIGQAKRKGISENFGQKEVRDLSDKYGREMFSFSIEGQEIRRLIDDFDSWAMDFDLSDLARFEGGGQTMSEFIAFYGGEKKILEATSLLDARDKAVEAFRVPKSKRGLLSVMNKQSYDNQDFRMYAKGGKTKREEYVANLPQHERWELVRDITDQSIEKMDSDGQLGALFEYGHHDLERKFVGRDKALQKAHDDNATFDLPTMNFITSEFAKGGIATAEMDDFGKNILGTASFDLKVKGAMRKPQNFTVYPMSGDSDKIYIQSDNRMGFIDPKTGRGAISKAYNYAGFSHLQKDISFGDATFFLLSDSQLTKLKDAIRGTFQKEAYSNKGAIGIDNRGSRSFAKGGMIRAFDEQMRELEIDPNDLWDEHDIQSRLVDGGYEWDEDSDDWQYYLDDIEYGVIEDKSGKVIGYLPFDEIDSAVVDSYAKGGKTKKKRKKVSDFDKLAMKVASRYRGKAVPKKYQKEYGKRYDNEEAMEVGRKVAAKVARQQMAKK